LAPCWIRPSASGSDFDAGGYLTAVPGQKLSNQATPGGRRCVGLLID
jgi:hypothetical protein